MSLKLQMSKMLKLQMSTMSHTRTLLNEMLKQRITFNKLMMDGYAPRLKGREEIGVSDRVLN
jgi:hypothetical protein